MFEVRPIPSFGVGMIIDLFQMAEIRQYETTSLYKAFRYSIALFSRFFKLSLSDTMKVPRK